MTSQLVELKLSAALKRRLFAIAKAGVLGRTVDEVVSHFTREALHRDWLAQEIERDRVPTPPATAPSPQGRPRNAESPPEFPQRAEKRLVRMPEVCKRIGVSRSKLYKMIGSRVFPAPRQVDGRTIRWLESEVDAWIDARTPGGSR